MDVTELNKYYNEIISGISKHKLHNAFELLLKLLKHCSNSDFMNRYENHHTTYLNLLKYSFEYQDDPEKKSVYEKLIQSLFKLSDEIKQDIQLSNKHKRYFQYKEGLNRFFKIDEKETSQVVESMAFEKEINQILDDSDQQTEKRTGNQDHSGNRRIDNIFKYLWLSDYYHRAESDLVMQIVKSEKLPWYDKCLIVTAVTLSALRFFDENKLILLFDLSEHHEDEIWQRSFIGLITNLLYYENRIAFYPEITNRLKIIQGNPKFNRNLELFVMQYTWQKESEKIAKKINEELLPDVMKMKSIIEEKLDLDNIVSSDPLKDKNPDWEDYFKDSPDLYKKFEEIQNLQTEGADVFMGAFAMLKHFPFFREISNWFIPFYPENQVIKNMSKELESGKDFANIIKGITSTYFLCNSDKYSFCHNLKFLIQAQQPAITDMFKSELDAMNEMAESDQLVGQNVKTRSIFIQYFQDLYRFYMLYPERNEFENIFELPVPLYKSQLIMNSNPESKIIHKLADFYFSRDNYDKALEIFKQIQDNNNNTEIIEKMAFCQQRLGNLDEAIQLYNKALLVDKNKKWKLQQMAFCHRKRRDFATALTYYKELEKNDSEDLNIQAEMGHVYLNMDDFENALKYYFKVEYLAPDNRRVHRPLAWCSFVLGKFEASKKYLEKLINQEKNKNDLMNLGHVLWCMDKKKDAILKYSESLKISDNNYKWFERVMLEDSKHLLKHGIDKLDIHLMIDFVKISVKSE